VFVGNYPSLVTSVLTDVPAATIEVKQTIKQKIKDALYHVGATSFKKAAKKFTQDTAYFLAVKMASGGPGQTELYIAEDYGEYMKKSVDGAIGDMVDEMVYSWTCEKEYEKVTTKEGCVKWGPGEIECLEWGALATKNKPKCKTPGIHLCEQDPGIKVPILVGLMAEYSTTAAEPPRCTWTELEKKFTKDFNIDVNVGYNFGKLTPLVYQAASQYQKNESKKSSSKNQQSTHDYLIEHLGELLDPSETDVGQFLTLSSYASNEKLESTIIALNERTTQFKSVEDVLTGRAETPALTIGHTFNTGIENVMKLGMDNFTGDLAADFIGTFTNTAARVLLDRLYKGLVDQSRSGGGGIGFSFGPPQYAVGGVSAAKAMYAEIKKPIFGQSGVMNVLGELASCPEQYPSVFNCTIDDNFQQAIENKMRLADAITEGQIDGNKPFAFDANGDTLELANGLPYKSILVLRKYGVIPVSWEIAARYIKDDYVKNKGSEPVTLNLLIKNFKNENSPYYGLVDENWVLTMQQNLCRRRGYSESVVSLEIVDDDGLTETPDKELISRNEECVDDQTCIAENPDGSCRAYGYCTKQKEIWRFLGESCESQYAGCKQYASRTGEQGVYIEDTLDKANCSADNIGCLWYCKDWNSETNKWDCYYNKEDDNYSAYSEVDFPSGLTTKQLAYLDADAKTCDESSAGCQEFLRMTGNLLANDGFEYTAKGDVADKQCIGGDRDGLVCDTLIDCPGSTDCRLERDVFLGWQVNEVETFAVAKEGGIQEPYNGDLAAYLKGSAGGVIRFNVDTGHSIANRKFTFSVYAVCKNGGSADGVIKLDGSVHQGAFSPLTVGASWERSSVSHTFDSTADEGQLRVEIVLPDPNLCELVVDAAQLEEAGQARDYINYEGGEYVYLNGGRKTCEAGDVGCALYTPVSGGLPIPGKYSDGVDTCPAQMAGCRAVEEVSLTPSNNIPDSQSPWMTGYRCSNNQSKSCDINTPNSCAALDGTCLPVVSLIPATGQQCSAAYQGCLEYTNLDVVAAGGEGREYYSYVRQCVKNDHQGVKKYHTWVGDDTKGLQLKEWMLLKSNLDEGPCQNLSVGPNESILACVDTSANFKCEDFGENPDCREYIDPVTLNKYYRYETKTIAASDDCHPLRNSITAADDNPDNDIYYGIPPQSYACPAAAAGCRAYRGNAGYNIREAMNDNFDDGTNNGWEGVVNSGESVYHGGRSGAVERQEIYKDVSRVIKKGKSYMLYFWAKGPMPGQNGPTIGFYDVVQKDWKGTLFADADRDTVFPGDMIVPEFDNWHPYSFGPVTVSWDPVTEPTQLLLEGLEGNGESFFDNIILTETADEFYLIKDTARLCAGNENCEQYLDAFGASHYLKSFSKICTEDVVGCQALFNTQNSVDPFEETYGNPDRESDITIPADSVEHFVVSQENLCSAEDKGCRALGKPKLTFNVLDNKEELTEYETIYLKDDPDQYNTT
ncbi:MAG: hypothetical protein V1701_09220, partial [Planctomycetota bacterium]